MSRVVLISVDGLNWDAVAACREGVENLRSLRARGAWVRRLMPAYPSLTMVCHATLATGVHPDRHGIFTNTRFVPEEVTRWVGGESREWHLDSRDVAAPALWRRAREQGLTSAILRWPITVGADATWVVPEVFEVGAKTPGADWRRTVEATDAELLRFLDRGSGFESPPGDHDGFDDWTARAAAHSIRELDPDLLLLHLNAYDHECHEHGLGSPESEDALRRADERIGRILREIDFEGACVFVFGDHGFLNFDRRVQINSLLAEHGWIRTDGERILDWQAIAHTSCAMAPVHLRDESRAAELLELLRRHEGSLYRVLPREELRRLRTGGDAVCAVECREGYSLGQELRGPLVTEVGRVRGEHGYEAIPTSLQSTLLAAGAGIDASVEIERAEMVDFAPTVAAALGIRLDGAEGRLIPLFRPPIAPRRSA